MITARMTPIPLPTWMSIVPGLLENRARIYYMMGNNVAFDQRVLGWINQVRGKARSGVHAPEELISLNHVLHDMRLYKSRQELNKLRRAATISANAHVRAMEDMPAGDEGIPG